MPSGLFTVVDVMCPIVMFTEENEVYGVVREEELMVRSVDHMPSPSVLGSDQERQLYLHDMACTRPRNRSETMSGFFKRRDKL